MFMRALLLVLRLIDVLKFPCSVPYSLIFCCTSDVIAWLYVRSVHGRRLVHRSVRPGSEGTAPSACAAAPRPSPLTTSATYLRVDRHTTTAVFTSRP